MSVTLFSFILVHFKSLKSCQLTVADNNVYPPLHTMQVISCNSNYQCLAATLCHLAQTPHNVLFHQNNPICTYVICSIIMTMISCTVIALVFTGNCWSIFLLMYGTLYEKKIHSIHQTQKLFSPNKLVEPAKCIPFHWLCSEQLLPISINIIYFTHNWLLLQFEDLYFLPKNLFHCSNRNILLYIYALCSTIVY